MASDFAYKRNGILLKVEGLAVRYHMPILEGVNLEIRDVVRPGSGIKQGQKVAILGPSGKGKTQLFNCLSGLQVPSSGTVLIGPEQKPVVAGEVGVVPQKYDHKSHLFHDRTIGSTLTTAARMKEKDKKTAREKALYVLNQFGLSDKWNSYPQEISGGQEQRVAIAEQLLCSNHFVLFDEPFSGLDILAKEVVCHLLDQVAEIDEETTLIITTHDIESAVEFADTIYLLGCEYDSHGNMVPGAHIKKSIDLIERNLAWHPEVAAQPEFIPTVKEIRAEFKHL
jgi:ABC-type nitrate/sulfonate/bicarbonate transport system ATPase subunit